MERNEMSWSELLESAVSAEEAGEYPPSWPARSVEREPCRSRRKPPLRRLALPLALSPTWRGCGPGTVPGRSDGGWPPSPAGHGCRPRGDARPYAALPAGCAVPSSCARPFRLPLSGFARKDEGSLASDQSYRPYHAGIALNRELERFNPRKQGSPKWDRRPRVDAPGRARRSMSVQSDFATALARVLEANR